MKWKILLSSGSVSLSRQKGFSVHKPSGTNTAVLDSETERRIFLCGKAVSL